MQFLTDKISAFSILSLSVLMVVVLSFVAFTPPTTNNYNLVESVAVKSTFFTSDFLNSVYVVSQQNQVLKYDSTGNLLAAYSNNKYGAVTSVDATSPFNVLVLHKDHSTLVTLDMRMNPRQLYKLSSVGITNISAACLSTDNRLWIFDVDEQKLKKIDENYETIHQSFNIEELIGQNITPNFMIERDGMVCLYIPDLGFMAFDVYGNYYTSISHTDLEMDNIDMFQVVNTKFVYHNKGQLGVYDLASGGISAVNLPKIKNIKQVQLQPGRLFILTNKELQFYKQQ